LHSIRLEVLQYDTMGMASAGGGGHIKMGIIHKDSIEAGSGI